jgi:surface protein
MFGGCNSLECLPDLSNLNTSSVIKIFAWYIGLGYFQCYQYGLDVLSMQFIDNTTRYIEMEHI